MQNLEKIISFINFINFYYMNNWLKFNYWPVLNIELFETFCNLIIRPQNFKKIMLLDNKCTCFAFLSKPTYKIILINVSVFFFKYYLMQEFMVQNYLSMQFICINIAKSVCFFKCSGVTGQAYQVLFTSVSYFKAAFSGINLYKAILV